MASEKNVELVGASQRALRLTGSEARTSVSLDAGMRGKVSDSLRAIGPSEPDRVFLNLENVTGVADATAFQVYVSAPAAGAAIAPPERLAGSIALFGVRKASLADGPHAGRGLTFVLDITKIVDDLHLSDAFDVDALEIRLVPVREVPEEAQVNIGRISVFRQGR